MSIPDSVVAEVLAKSARHCCICRQFVPLQLQVHHIVEQADGGTDDFDNLIPICITCHSSVHTKTHMTRNFSPVELKLHRDHVYEMVELGKLPASKPLSHTEIAAITSSILDSLGRNESQDNDLPRDATEILLAAVVEDAPIEIDKIQGSEDSVALRIGHQLMIVRTKAQAQFPDPVLRLIAEGMANVDGEGVRVTSKGQAHVEKLVTTTAKFVAKKVKCMACGLHFIICTWDIDRHNKGNLTCPECGQHSGKFLVWTQQQFGFIFEHVPGHATLTDC